MRYLRLLHDFGPRRPLAEVLPSPYVVQIFWKHQMTSGLEGILPGIDRICIVLF